MVLLTKNLIKLISFKTFEIDNITVNALSLYTASMDLPVTEFAVQSISSIIISNASSEGTNYGFCVPNAWYINNNIAYIRILNTNSTKAAKIKITFRCMSELSTLHE